MSASPVADLECASNGECAAQYNDLARNPTCGGQLTQDEEQHIHLEVITFTRTNTI